MTPWIGWAGDLLIFLAFATIGRASHGRLTEGPALWGVIQAAAPFVIAWGIVAGGLVRLRPPDPGRSSAAVAGRVGIAWLGAWGLGLLLRSLLLGRPAPPPFALITLVGNGILLIAWRSLLQAWTRRRAASGV